MRCRNVSIPAPRRRPAAAGLLFFIFAACIQRTAPPAGSPAQPAAAAPVVDTGLERANARIADLTRTDLLAGASAMAFKLQGETGKVSLTEVDVSGQPFAKAVRAEIKEGSRSEFAVQMVAPIASAVAAGDVLLATFFLKTEVPPEGSVGETEFVFELGRAPYAKSVQYPIQGFGDWTKVQVRFTAARAYAAGEANVIFRLGYEPEIVQFGGVTVENFGKQVPLATLPSTQNQDKRREKQAAAAASKAAGDQSPVAGGELRIAVAASDVIGPISPYVYGINSQKVEGSNPTVKRMGGNRQSGYNWENNASNAGADYHHNSDEWACTVLGYRDCDQPGAQVIDFARINHEAKIESLVTIPLVDYVTADKRGGVSENEKAPSARWNRSFPAKGGPFSVTPDLSDGKVYEDELVNLLVQKTGHAGQGGVRFYALDNEPALWPSTHPRIHPDKTGYDEMVKRSEATAAAILKVDPEAMIFGAVAFGWSEFMNLNEAPDFRDYNTRYGTYLDFFLASMKNLEAQHKTRLVHVLDVHWYPEARGAKRITEGDVSPKTVAARLQAPRSLWDPTYVEKSWIAGQLQGKPIRLIPWLRDKVAERYPGTKLAITEYNFGVGDHISGGLAQADVLGVFGREGLFMGNYWGDGPGNGRLPGYINAAFHLYRNYDGKNGTFGDTAVKAAPADLDKASVFAATDSHRPGVLTILVINKELRASFDGKLEIKGGDYARAHVFRMDAKAAEVRAEGEVDIRGGSLAYSLPPLSATLFVCERK